MKHSRRSFLTRLGIGCAAAPLVPKALSDIVGRKMATVPPPLKLPFTTEPYTFVTYHFKLDENSKVMLRRAIFTTEDEDGLVLRYKKVDTDNLFPKV